MPDPMSDDQIVNAKLYFAGQVTDIAERLRRLADRIEKHAGWVDAVAADPKRDFAHEAEAIQHDVHSALPQLGLGRLTVLARNADHVADREFNV